VQHIGHAIDIRGNITHPLLGWSPENPRCCVSRELQSVTGAAFIVRRSVFLRAGGFFEGYGRGYFEDVDLNLTIRTIPNGHGSNYKVWINAEATADHYAGYTFVKKQEPTNMEGNRMLLLSRKSGLMVNDSWSIW
jgi:GT2 family glycosyltransferase